MEAAAIFAAISAIGHAIFLLIVISTVIVVAWMFWRVHFW